MQRKMDFNIRLINEVKKYTMLYNMSSQGYFNVRKKERVWTLIAHRLDSDINSCKSKWKSLRDMYMRFKKRLDTGKAPANNRHWKYYEMLDFLTQYNSKTKLTDWEIIVGEDKEGKKIDNVNRLIEEIKQCPDLYDRNAQGYTERDAKEKIWKEISEHMQIDVLSCKLKWKGLRDSFKRFQKRPPKPDAQKWKYYDSLLFLNECHSISKTENISCDCDESSMEDEYFKDSKKFRDWDTSTQINSEGLLTNNTYRLIEEVRNHPVIYAGQRIFEQKESCENAWKSISEELQIDESACKVKWKGLKDSFMRIKNTKKSCKWQYYESMQFLNDYLEGFSANNSITSDPLDCDERNDYDHDLEDFKTEVEQEVHLDNNEVQQNMHSEGDMVTEEFLTIDHIIETQPLDNKQYILTIPESNGDEYVSLDIQNSATFSIEEYNLQKSRSLHEPTDVPILYLREDDDEDSNEFLSFTDALQKSNKQKQEDFTDLFRRSMEEYKERSETNEPQAKDSVDILFGSLAYSIKNANLPEDKLMALQANICAYAYGQLAELKKQKTRESL